MQNILNGKLLAEQMQSSLKKQVEILPYTVCLAVVLVGEDSASQIYVQNKVKACKNVGITCKVHTFSADVQEEEIASCLQQLAADSHVHGILLQMPLPQKFNSEKLLKIIPPEKDVDGFCIENIGRLVQQGGMSNGFIACTPLAVMQILKANGVEIAGKNAVVVGRSNTVGKPLSLLLLAEGATVTICHSHTNNLAAYTKQADILVVAVGKANLITADMVKQGVIVVDVGINRLNTGKIVGDVDFESLQKKAAAITPVPGGVGPMTITMLLYNCILAAKQQME